MKKIVLLLFVACMGTSIYSKSLYEIADPYCKAFQELGGLAMKSRQANLTASDTTSNILKIINDSKGSTDHFKNIAMKIVKKAYQKPIEESFTDKDIAVREFKNHVYLNCVPLIEDELNSK